MVRLTHKVLAFFVFLFVVVGSAIGQQQDASITWDFSYKSILEQNKVADDAVVRRWWAGVKSPAEKWVKNWSGKPIKSAILIEYPAFHAAERQSLLFVRTGDEAHYWESTEALHSMTGNPEDRIEDVVGPDLYDALYDEAFKWQQLQPKRAEDLPEQVFPGYMGFISIYGPRGSKQMLLTFDDFFLCPQKVCEPGKGKLGRLMAALGPVITPESHKNYKHKSEAEIARMTPEQRIDEQILEDDNHLLDHNDKQSQLITKYRRLDGLKGSNHLILLMESYKSRARRSSYYEALMMASEVDERVARLRASEEGRRTIAAMERLAARLKAGGESDASAELYLRGVRGTNIADGEISETLWLRHRIKLTDDEMLKFSNFLVEYDPTYPSWSERESTKNSPRIIMKDSKRFYQAYLAFKRSHPKK